MLTRCLLLLILNCISVLGHQQQHGFTANVGTATNNGVVRRYNIDSLTLEQVLITAQEYDLDIWHVTPSYIDIFSPLDAPPLPHDLQSLPHSTTQISAPIMINPTHIEKDWVLSSLENTTFHDSYHPLSQVESFMQELVDAYPTIVHLNVIGRSAEGRDIYGLTISSGEDEESGVEKRKKRKNKKKRLEKQRRKLGFVIQGAQHAREWIATATSLYISHALVANTSEHHSLSHLLDYFDFHIIPMPNPDGYDYTWKEDRFWYKNRQIISSDSSCIGLDMNRNWGYKWKPHRLIKAKLDNTNISTTTSATKSPTKSVLCSHWYSGSRAFQSPEVNDIANWVTTLQNLIGFIDLRSYGQMLSTPYSYSCKRWSADAEDQLEAALGASRSLKSAHGTVFETGSLCSMLYTAPGNILDWMYARRKIKFSYAVHLRDTGTFGFSLPEGSIRPTGEETIKLVDYLAQFIAQHKNRKF